MTPEMAAILKSIYGDCEGPFGFTMRSDAAKEVETLVKTLPQECRDMGFQRGIFIPKSVEFKEGERADISIITSAALDRDMEVMNPKGADWKQFIKNPVVPFAHDYRSLPVGRAQWVKKQDGPKGMEWIAKTIYATAPAGWKGDWFPDAVWHMIKTGIVSGKSIGFYPTEIRRVEPKDIEARPELAKCRCIIEKYLVLEYSVAPVQSNPDALTEQVAKCKSAGITVPTAFYDALGIFITDEPAQVKGLDDGILSTGVVPPTELSVDQMERLKGLMRSESDVQQEALTIAMKRLGNIDVNAVVGECFARRSGKMN